MDRVVVFVCAGSGKTTLARELAARTGLPLVERDALDDLGSPGYLAAIGAMLSQPRWLLDGAPYYAEGLVYPAADTVIVLDYPRPVAMWRGPAPHRSGGGGAPAGPHLPARPGGLAWIPSTRSGARGTRTGTADSRGPGPAVPPGPGPRPRDRGSPARPPPAAGSGSKATPGDQ